MSTFRALRLFIARLENIRGIANLPLEKLRNAEDKYLRSVFDQPGYRHWLRRCCECKLHD